MTSIASPALFPPLLVPRRLSLCLQDPCLSFQRSSFVPCSVGPGLERDPFTKSFCSSFLPVCNLCIPYHRVCHQCQIQLSCEPKNTPASISCSHFWPRNTKYGSLHFLSMPTLLWPLHCSHLCHVSTTLY